MAEPNGTRFARLRTTLARHVTADGGVPGLLALAHRRGETRIETLGTFEPAGAGAPVRRATLFRIASLTKAVTAATALTLVEECRLRLDDPVDPFLPELADRRVLSRPDAPLDDTVPADRPLTLRDLLTCRFGLGVMPFPPGATPIQRAIDEAGLQPGMDAPPLSADEYAKRIGALPLAHQPGTAFRYDTGLHLAAILVGRAAGRPYDEVLQERILTPLGMRDTGYQVPRSALDRLPPQYGSGAPGGPPVQLDAGGAASRYAAPPSVSCGATGLVSTADDYLAFLRMLLDGGRAPGERGRVLSRAAVELMTTDRTTEANRVGSGVLGPGTGWGFGLGVTLRREVLGPGPGSYGWSGGSGTTAFVDPAEGLIGILLTQRAMDSSANPKVFDDFTTSVYQSLDDD